MAFEKKKRCVQITIEDVEDMCDKLKKEINEDPDFGNDEVELAIIITKQKVITIQ